MGFLGDRLKQEREAQGVSLEKISEQTRIGVRLLRAIEQEAFDQLPGGVFNRSFVRQYARCLGLEEDPAVQDYLRVAGAACESLARPDSASPKTALGVSIYPRLILGAITLGLIAIALLFLVDYLGQPQESGTSSASVTAAPMAPAERPVSSALPASATTPALPAVAASGGAEELLLQIHARNAVWLSITADGEKQWQGTLPPNQTRAVQATEFIRVIVGNAGGVELTLNGKPLGALGREGQVKTLTLTARALESPIP